MNLPKLRSKDTQEGQFTECKLYFIKCEVKQQLMGRNNGRSLGQQALRWGREELALGGNRGPKSSLQEAGF